MVHGGCESPLNVDNALFDHFSPAAKRVAEEHCPRAVGHLECRRPDCTLTRAHAPSETDTSARGAYLSPADRSASLAQVRKTIHFCILREYIVTQKRRYKSVCVQDISNDIHRKLFGNGRQWPVKTLGEPTFNWASDTFTARTS